MSVEPCTEGALYYDAHLHLQDQDLADLSVGICGGGNVAAQVCNGTHPDDWAAVSALQGDGQTAVMKAYGVHPWKVDSLPRDWEERLRERLNSGAVSVGEIGLDRWIEVKDEQLQLEVFERQLQIAHEFDLVPTIHCLRAWGLLLDTLKAGPELRRGFLVHGFGGSREVLFQLVDLGGHASFSAYAGEPKRSRMRDAIRACPAHRLLAETDAPDMVPPRDVCTYPLESAAGKRLHHPLEITTAYRLLAELRNVTVEELSPLIEANFKRLFTPS